MEHTHAYDAHAAERYLLGELPAAEAEEFELHYFECARCALAVESGGQFIDDARQAFEEDATGPRRIPEAPRNSFWDSLAASVASVWRRPAFAFPVAAALLFGAIALYQGTVLIPEARRAVESARVLPAFQLIGASRGEGTQIKVAADASSFALSLDIPPDAHFNQYACVLSSEGRTVFRVVSPAPSEGQPITILVPTKDLQPGNKELTVFGVTPDGRQADKISSYPFDFSNQPVR